MILNSKYVYPSILDGLLHITVVDDMRDLL